jgi:uncharacterized protein YjbI with pentapeptide repeats
MEDSYSKENFRTYVQTLPPLDLDKATLGALRDRRELIRGYIDNLPKTPEGRPDLSGADLSGLNLAFADLFRVDLTEANLNGASLYQASITFARLENAIMRDADLRGVQALSAKLIGADITGARLDPIVAADNSLTYPNFVGAKLLRIKGLLGGGQDFDQKTPKRFIQITKDTTLIDDKRPEEGCLDELLIFFLLNENLNNALDKYIETQATVDSPQENYSAVKGSIDNAIKEWERFFESCKPKSKESVVTVPLGDSFNLVLEAPDFDAWRNDIIGTISFQYGWIHTDLIEGDYPESYRWLESVRGQIHGNAALLIKQIMENRSLG